VLLLLALGPVLEGALGQVDTGDSLGDDVGAESLAGISGDFFSPRPDLDEENRAGWVGRRKVYLAGCKGR